MVKTSRQSTQIRITTENKNVIRLLNREWDGITEAEDFPVIGMKMGHVLSTPVPGQYTAQSATMAVGIANPCALPQSLEVRGRRCHFDPCLPVAVEGRTAARAGNYQHPNPHPSEARSHGTMEL
jgi:hypothetical protein